MLRPISQGDDGHDPWRHDGGRGDRDGDGDRRQRNRWDAVRAAFATGATRAGTTTQPTPAQLAAANPQVTKGEFTGSTVYPGTWREYWVYIPKQLDRTKPAPVMVFQDGLQYNAPNVFDDLIAKKAIPPLVGVFVMHGRVKALSAGRARSHEPQLRIRRGERRLREVPARRITSVRRQDPQPERSRTIRTTAPSPATAAARSPPSSPPGSVPTPFAACSPRSAPTSACAAATSSRC